MSDLDAILALTPTGPGQFRAEVPDGWQQGRGAFGGLVIALLVRAAAAAAADPTRPLRSLGAELCGPTQPGPADLFVDALRTGTGVTTLAVRLVQAGEVQAHAVAVHARTRDAGLQWTELRPPEFTAPSELPLGTPEEAPVFAQHCEFRPVHAPLFTGGDEARAEGWFRFKRPPSVRDAAYLAMLCDGWWPAVFSRLTSPRPTATLTYTLQPLADVAQLDPAQPVYHRARAVAMRAGYSVEFRELWSPAGELLALNQQTFAVIR
ncbi:thioesterase family protein [Nannocystis pusilla]|uniref:Thioesterase family protein n=1 Tax=Nannocystis pusilla TaxID=889268 RepID=A0A9X3EQQ7_9BACT|nr:thioesterase family protein [Nannocystis pusilla]MCY1008300.1 thioesterase family protein [Nannocystis pusilla]